MRCWPRQPQNRCIWFTDLFGFERTNEGGTCYLPSMGWLTGSKGSAVFCRQILWRLFGCYFLGFFSLFFDSSQICYTCGKVVFCVYINLFYFLCSFIFLVLFWTWDFKERLRGNSCWCCCLFCFKLFCKRFYADDMFGWGICRFVFLLFCFVSLEAKYYWCFVFLIDLVYK